MLDPYTDQVASMSAADIDLGSQSGALSPMQLSAAADDSNPGRRQAVWRGSRERTTRENRDPPFWGSLIHGDLAIHASRSRVGLWSGRALGGEVGRW